MQSGLFAYFARNPAMFSGYVLDKDREGLGGRRWTDCWQTTRRLKLLNCIAVRGTLVVDNLVLY
eukprot:436661-Rhodomonas_salina.1